MEYNKDRLTLVKRNIEERVQGVLVSSGCLSQVFFTVTLNRVLYSNGNHNSPMCLEKEKVLCRFQSITSLLDAHDFHILEPLEYIH